MFGERIHTLAAICNVAVYHYHMGVIVPKWVKGLPRKLCTWLRKKSSQLPEDYIFQNRFHDHLDAVGMKMWIWLRTMIADWMRDETVRDEEAAKKSASRYARRQKEYVNAAYESGGNLDGATKAPVGIPGPPQAAQRPWQSRRLGPVRVALSFARGTSRSPGRGTTWPSKVAHQFANKQPFAHRERYLFMVGKPGPNGARLAAATTMCWNCGTAGHFARDCPKGSSIHMIEGGLYALHACFGKDFEDIIQQQGYTAQGCEAERGLALNAVCEASLMDEPGLDHLVHQGEPREPQQLEDAEHRMISDSSAGSSPASSP